MELFHWSTSRDGRLPSSVGFPALYRSRSYDPCHSMSLDVFLHNPLFFILDELAHEKQVEIDQFLQSEVTFKAHIKTCKDALTDIDDILIRWQNDVYFEI